jgi:4-amino-4-deoxy-L-arabinose transferase-like glycosyltransferase
MQLASGRQRLLLFAVVALLSALWLIALGARDLAKTDEGRYAEIPREMVASGDWLTPRLDGLKYFEKPALQYWATAIAYSAFGLSEWSSRLWTGLTALLGVFVIGLTATRLYGAQCGALASAVLASSLLYLLMGHVDTLDMGLTFFMTAGLCATLLARASADVRATRRLMLTAWAAFAAAVLSKGLIGIVLPGAVLVVYLAATRDWLLVKRIEALRGPLLFLVIAAPWFVAVSLVNPGFAHFFFIHEHFERFLTTSHHREGPWWYFVPILALGILPWLSWLPQALWHGLREGAVGESRAPFAAGRLLVIWIAFIFVFFSASGSKLPSYILPIFPALALLIARSIEATSTQALRLHAAFVALLAAGVAYLGLQPGSLGEHPGDALLTAASTRFGYSLLAAAALWFAGALALALLARRHATLAPLALALASLAAGLVALTGYSALDRSASAHYVATLLAPQIDANTALYSVEMYDQTLPFYLQRTLTLVNQRDELDFGLTEEPGLGISDLASFASRWAADAHAVAIMPPTTYPKLQALNLPMRVILMDRRFVVVSKP